MSNHALNWAFSTPLKTTQKFVLVALADYADEKNSCHPSHKSTAGRVGASVATVRRAIEALEDSGYLKVQRRATKDGRQTSNRYILNVGFMGAHFEQGGAHFEQGGAHQRAGVVLTDEQGWCSPVSMTGCSPVSNEPSYEPSLNPQLNPSESASDSEPDGSLGKSNLTTPQQVTNTVFEAVNGSINYMAVLNVVKYHLSEKRKPLRSPDAVCRACIDLYNSGRPITNQTVGQMIDGKFSNPNQSQFQGKVQYMIAEAQAMQARTTPRMELDP